MIDLRTGTLLDFLPESLATETDVVAISKALDPEIRAVASAIVEAVIWPNIANLPEPVLDELAWSIRFQELALWDTATLAGKREILTGIFAARKKFGSRYSVRRIFDLIQVTGAVIEWWQDSPVAAPHTYRIEVTVPGDPGLSLFTILQIPALLLRCARASQKLTELAVISESEGDLLLYPALTVGRHTSIPWGG
jgi:phage tail P2-like protein